jgi:ABC-type multidrug transport system fused ATPase/permease subunit
MNRKIAFVGGSGGGKSTIAQLLIRFYEPYKGNIRVNGFPLQDFERKSWSDKVAIVFQEPYLFPDTIRNNLLLDKKEMLEEEIIEACRIACIHNFIESLPDGYDTMLGERGITLSGGQRQRIALARSVLRKPEILILDEATSALDLHTEREVMRNLDEQRQGSLTIIIAHRLSTVANADMIVVMDKGKITEQGKHEELMDKNSVYKSLHSMQSESVGV